MENQVTFNCFMSLPYELRHYIYTLATPSRVVCVEEGPINVKEKRLWRERGYDNYLQYAFERFFDQALNGPPALNIKLHPDLAHFAHNWRNRIPRSLLQLKQQRLEAYGFTSSRPPYQPWPPSPEVPSIPIEWLINYPELAFELTRESCLRGTAAIPAFLHVCAESRGALVAWGYQLMFATRTAEPRTWFHPGRDRLYIPHTVHPRPLTKVNLRPEPMPFLDPDYHPRGLLSGCYWDIGQYCVRDLRRVRYLMLGSGNISEYEDEVAPDIQNILPLLSSLESIYIEGWTKEDIIGWYRHSGAPFSLEASRKMNSVSCVSVEDIDIVGSVYWEITSDSDNDREWPGRLRLAGYANQLYNRHKHHHTTHYPEAKASTLRNKLLSWKPSSYSSTGQNVRVPTIQYVHSCPEALSHSFTTGRYRFWSILQSLGGPSPEYSNDPSIFLELESLPVPFRIRWKYNERYQMEWPEFLAHIRQRGTPYYPEDDWSNAELQAWYLNHYWIYNIPSHGTSTSESKPKRIKTSHEPSSWPLPTPSHDTMSSPTKRPRYVSDDGSDDLSQSFVEDDMTPKAPKRRGRLYHAIRSASETSSRSRNSSRSKVSSPLKQQRDATGEESGYRIVSIKRYEDLQPDSLKEMRRVLEDIEYGIRDPKDEFQKSKFPQTAFFDAALATNLPSGVDWRWPDMSWVDGLFDRVAEYLEENEAEAGWNIGIHAPIHDWTFHKDKPRPRFLDYTSCTLTQISTMFKPTKSKSKLIETKREGEDYTNAINQMATWHSAQLRSLCYLSPGISRTLSHIELLPGIIVQGHDWNFVATIQRDKKVFTFHKLPIGTTLSRQGIFKVLLALQYLKHWIQIEYWSAFKMDILETGDIAAVSCADG
ncbi:hypothetical protein NM208_g2239 [Fusarium decemcellulare]|uniref:Uncharacterized protein n=1 Tax=Fusarium decemcellulare TaxID=57161 RepID=A0ACC1ST48_9HYPO|nr:hypothetical protein NM208_g2239 [Fusarium decemcellulare]